MSVSFPLIFASSTESQVEEGEVRATAQPAPGNNSSGETADTQVRHSSSSAAEDEVKVQWEPPGEISVYRFLNQQGSLVLQVPPQIMLNLALEISQELAPQTSPKVEGATEGGKKHGR